MDPPRQDRARIPDRIRHTSDDPEVTTMDEGSDHLDQLFKDAAQNAAGLA